MKVQCLAFVSLANFKHSKYLLIGVIMEKKPQISVGSLFLFKMKDKPLNLLTSTLRFSVGNNRENLYYIFIFKVVKGV